MELIDGLYPGAGSARHRCDAALARRRRLLDPALQLIEEETESGIDAAIAALPSATAALLTKGVLEARPLDVLAAEARRTVSELQSELEAALSYVAGAIGLAGLDGVERPVLLDPSGRPLQDGSAELREIEIRFGAIGEDLIACLAAEPRWLHELSSRRFEELVAELYARRGFHVQLTPASKDHGVDVLVARHDELGSSLTVVQCKRYTPEHKVGVRLVRELKGAMTMTRGATAAALVTTSFFTSPARALEREYRYTLSLQDYFVLQSLLRLSPREAPDGF